MKLITAFLISTLLLFATTAFSGTMQNGSPAESIAPMPLAPVAMPLDGSWVILDQNLPPLPAPFFDNYFWSSGNPVVFHITDLFVVTDAYDVLDFGAFIFSTPLLPDWFALGEVDPFGPTWTNDPDVAWLSPLFSKGAWQFAPGTHDLTIIATQLPTGFSDSTVAFRALPVPLCDIKPGSDPNSINPKSNGVIPVALLGSAEVDIYGVDVSTLFFAGAYPAHDLTDPYVYNDHLQDVNDDGYLDLVSHYPVQDTWIAKGDTYATIYAAINGVYFYCTDDIKTPGN